MNLNQIREQLVQRQAMLEARVDKVTRDASHRDEPVSADFAEQATERENDDVLRAIGDESRLEISRIRQALQRIEDGSYGDCSSCGKRIAEERLLAVPYTTLCIHCAAAQE